MHCQCIGTSIIHLTRSSAARWSYLPVSALNYPSPQKMAKRKVDFENRGFILRRVEGRVYIHWCKDKAVCLLCRDSVALMKDDNVRGHFEMGHHDRYEHLDMNQTLQKLEELKRSLVSKQAMFTKAKSHSEAAVTARFIVAAEVAKSGGEFVKKLHDESLRHRVPRKKASIFKWFSFALG